MSALERRPDVGGGRRVAARVPQLLEALLMRLQSHL